jgi:hypothetical protein
MLYAKKINLRTSVAFSILNMKVALVLFQQDPYLEYRVLDTTHPLACFLLKNDLDAIDLPALCKDEDKNGYDYMPENWGALRRTVFVELVKALQWPDDGSASAELFHELEIMCGQTMSLHDKILTVTIHEPNQYKEHHLPEPFWEFDKETLLQLFSILQPDASPPPTPNAAWRQHAPPDMIAMFDNMKDEEDEELDPKLACILANMRTPSETSDVSSEDDT